MVPTSLKLAHNKVRRVYRDVFVRHCEANVSTLLIIEKRLFSLLSHLFPGTRSKGFSGMPSLGLSPLIITFAKQIISDKSWPLSVRGSSAGWDKGQERFWWRS